DIPQIQSVLFNTWVAAYAEFIPIQDIQWYFNNYYSESRFREMADETTTWNFVAEIHGQLAGYARAKIHGDDKNFYVESLYVLPEFQGKGIGIELLKICESYAKERNFSQVWLGVMEKNVKTLAWYKKLGFEFTAEAPFVMGETTVNHLIGYRTIL
ncbi:MAG: GNAT family N-acetyltransferase, partial [Bacteroidetes bacterium]|nr:GNAT family N-acetyltransferase [Bacteroidota bacterium]